MEKSFYPYPSSNRNYGTVIAIQAFAHDNKRQLSYRGMCKHWSWWRHQMEKNSALLALCEGDFTGHRRIPLIKASDADLRCFLWSAPEQTVGQTIETLVSTIPERKFVTKIRVRYHDRRWRRQQPVRVFTPRFLLFRIVFHMFDAG